MLDPAVPWDWLGPPWCHLGGGPRSPCGGGGQAGSPVPGLPCPSPPRQPSPAAADVPAHLHPRLQVLGGPAPALPGTAPPAQAPPLRVGVAGWVWPWVSPPAGGAWLGVFHQVMGWWHVSPCPGGPVCPWAMLAVHVPVPWWPRVSPSPGLVSVPLAWVAPCVPPGYRVVVSPCPGGSPCLWATG